MRKKYTPALAMAILMLSSSVLLAQKIGPPPTSAQMVSHQVSRLTSLLTLTSAQQTQLSTILTEEQTALSTARESMRAAHKALQTSIETNDTAAIATQATQIGALTTQQVQAHAIAQAALFALLTPDQQTKYKLLMPTGPGGFEGPGPSGPPLH